MCVIGSIRVVFEGGGCRGLPQKFFFAVFIQIGAISAIKMGIMKQQECYCFEF